jgi:hypothetical protein
MTNKNYFKGLFTQTRAWAFIFTLITCGMMSFSGNAQVANYTFAASSGTYTAISGGTVPGIASNPGAWDDGTSNIASNIGFTFTFNGLTYTQCAITTNMAISFGATAITSTNYTCISSTAGYAGAVGAWSRDMQGSTTAMSGANGEVRYQTTGSVGSRIFTVQWANARRYNSTTSTNESVNVQIKLFETTNVVQIVYGTWSTPVLNSSGNTTALGQVGLRGASNADRKNLEVLSTGNWATPTAGTANTQTCYYNHATPAVLPASGQTYTFTPPAPPACTTPGGLTVTYLTSSTASVSWTGAASAVVEWGASGCVAGTGAGAGACGNVLPAGASPKTITGLTPNTTYSVYVRQDCTGSSNGYSSNVSTSYFNPPACPTNLGVNSVTIGSLPYSTTGQTTCGSGNNVTSSNVTTVCGSTNYYTGEDRTYIFTPTSTGIHNILLTTISDDDAGIQLYQ